MNGKIISASSQLQFIAITVDIMHGCDSSNKLRHQLKPEKTRVTVY